jgi:hypothetical protein
MVLCEPLPRVAYRPDHARLQVRPAADVVHHARARRVHEHPVDREVTPLGVLARVGERDGVRPTTVGVARFAAKRRDLDLERSVLHDNHAERRPDREGSRKQGQDLVGPGARGHVVILGQPREEKIADAPAR